MQAGSPNRAGTFSVTLLRLCCTTHVAVSEQCRRFSDFSSTSVHSQAVMHMVRPHTDYDVINLDVSGCGVFISLTANVAEKRQFPEQS